MTEEIPPKPPEPILSIDLGDNGGAHQFFTLQNIYEWIDAEAAPWSFLSDGNNRLDGVQVEAGPPLRIHAFKAKLSSSRSQSPIGQKGVEQSIVNEFHTWIQQTYRATPPTLVHSSSRLGSFILDLSKHNPKEAMWVWLVWVRPKEISLQKQGWLNSMSATAIMKAVEFETGFGHSKPQVSALKAIHSKWREVLTNEHQAFQDQLNLATKLRADVANQITELIEQRKQAKADHESLREEHRIQMVLIEERFIEKMAVKASVKYWRKRAVVHRKHSKSWGAIASAYALFVFILLPILHASMTGLPQYIKDLMADGSLDTAAQSALITQSGITSAIRFIVMALLAMWPLRIFVRNYLSNSHLEADASERKIIVETYLALINDPEIMRKEGLKEQILPHALQNIFRHTADGIVKDDAAPWQSIVDNFAKKAGIT